MNRVELGRLPILFHHQLDPQADGHVVSITTKSRGSKTAVLEREAPSEESALKPVVNVSWEDAVEFCNRLSEKEGYRACYRKEQQGVWTCDWQSDGYRLPTEAEWEYACRAGTTTRYSFGDDPENLGAYAWFGRDWKEGSQPVATKLPNPWGLYDMHGNVWEWCWDWYAPYSAEPAKDPRSPEGHGRDVRQVPGWARRGSSALEPLRLVVRWLIHGWPRLFRLKKRDAGRRVLRGGSFGYTPGDLRSAFRDVGEPESTYVDVGFRCVRVPPQL